MEQNNKFNFNTVLLDNIMLKLGWFRPSKAFIYIRNLEKERQEAVLPWVKKAVEIIVFPYDDFGGNIENLLNGATKTKMNSDDIEKHVKDFLPDCSRIIVSADHSIEQVLETTADYWWRKLYGKEDYKDTIKAYEGFTRKKYIPLDKMCQK